MKTSFLEDFLQKTKRENKTQTIVACISILLSVFVFLSTTLLISHDAITMENEQGSSDTEILSQVEYAYEILDFKEYLLDVNMKKEKNGEYIDFTEIYDKDKVKIELIYQLNDGTLVEGQNKISYQLPVGINLNSKLFGKVYVANEAAGTYVIDENGLITITFYESFKYTESFIGTVTFEGEIDASGLGESKEIEFKNDIKFQVSEEVTQTNYDIYGSKAQTGKDENAYNFEVIVNSKNGSGEPISMKDSFATYAQGLENADYNEGSFVITYCASDGTISTIDPTDYLSINNNDESSYFNIDNLPALNAGDYYKVAYSATPTGAVTPSQNGASNISNSVTVTSADKKFTKNTYAKANDPVISKLGKYDSESGMASWEVTINPGHDGLSGYTFDDLISMDNATDIAVSSATITDSTTGESVDIPVPYTFGDEFDPNHSYKITYSTDILNQIPANTNVNVSNEASMQNESYTFTAKASLPPISKTTYGLTKEPTQSDKESGTFGWKSSIILPNNANEVTEALIYIDTMANLQGGNYPNNSQYTTIGALNEMAVRIDGSTIPTENYSIKATGLDFKTYTDFSVDPSTKLGNFTITFSQDFISQNQGKTITLDYNTYIAVDLTIEGVTYIVKNNAQVGSKTVSSEAEYKRGKGISKFVSANGSNYVENLPNEVEYSTIYDKNLGTAVMNYRITLTTGMYEDLPAFMQDILPESTSLVKDSVVVKFKLNNGFWVTENYYSQYLGKNISASDYITYEVKDGIIQFNIDDSFIPAFEADNQNVDFEVYYKIALPSVSDWDEYAKAEFVNALSCGPDFTSNKVTVKNSDAYMAKFGSQETTTDEDGNVTYENSALYKLIVNKSKAKLSVSSTKINVVDTMSLTDRGGSFATLNRGCIVVYYYDENAVDFKGEILDKSKYSYTTQTVDKQNGHDYNITFVLPDEQAFIVEYKYDINYQDSAIKELALTNQATINGLDSAKDESKLQMLKSTSSATVLQKVLNLYKHEEGNENKPLPGAEFTFEKYDDVDSNGEYAWIASAIGTQTTDEDGIIKITLYDNFSNLIHEEDVLYRAKETAPPEGYALSDEVNYFVWVKKGSTVAESSSNVILPTGVSLDQITFITDDETTILISNEKNSLTVTKDWISEDFREIEPVFDSIECALYQQVASSSAPDADGNFVATGEKVLIKSFNLTKSENWQKQFSLIDASTYEENQLPKTDPETGNLYVYTVAELSDLDGFTVSYSDNNSQGVHLGQIFITNQQTGYELPETGGLSPFVCQIFGLISILLFTFFAFCMHCKKPTEGSVKRKYKK